MISQPARSDTRLSNLVLNIGHALPMAANLLPLVIGINPQLAGDFEFMHLKIRFSRTGSCNR